MAASHVQHEQGAPKRRAMVAGAVAGVLGGCTGCMLSVEMLAYRGGHGCMNLVWCATSLFVALMTLAKQSHFFTKLPRRKVPLRNYATIVVIFFIVNYANNYAITCGISMPLFIIFRSGTLLANIVLNFVIKSRVCSRSNLLASLLVTAGVIIFTLADESRNDARKEAQFAVNHTSLPHFSPHFVGLLMLTSALFLSAYLGICQEDMYSLYGRHSDEAMLYVHAMSLPGFLLLRDDICRVAAVFTKSDRLNILGIATPLPSLWTYLLVVCIFQWLCIANVYTLTAKTSSLNVTMVITLRKFVSVGLSVLVFKNSFTAFHFVGSLFVSVGTVMFSLLSDATIASNVSKKKFC